MAILNKTDEFNKYHDKDSASEGQTLVWNDTAGEWELDVRYVRLDADTAPDADETYTVGTSASKFLNIHSATFTGTATQAQYADLAEIFMCNPDLEIGTVVKVTSEGIYEVTPTTDDCCDFIGVISEKPAYLMNCRAQGLPVALVGRVPVKIDGPIRKGERIIPTFKGKARRLQDKSEMLYSMGFALDDKRDSDLVECILK